MNATNATYAMYHIKRFTFRSVIIAALAVLFVWGSTAQATSLSLHGGWSIVQSPSPGANGNDLSGVTAISARDVWAVGTTVTSNSAMLIEHWNGSAWTVVNTPNPPNQYNNLVGVTAISSNDIWAVGDYYTSSIPAQTLAVHWNGSNWSQVSSPNPSSFVDDLSSVSADVTNDVWAVGIYSNRGQAAQTLIEHWDGSSWSVVPSPNVGSNINVLNGVATISPTDAWAVGYYIDGTSIQTHALIEHWDGSTWSIVTSPTPDAHNYTLNAISGVSAGDIWAVGNYKKINGRDRVLIEHWNGTQWELVSSPSIGTTDNDLASIASLSTNDVWAVGTFRSGNAPVQTLTEHWNGSYWHIVSSPNAGSSDNVLYGVAQVPGTKNTWTVGDYFNSSFVNQTLTELFSS